MSKTQKTAWLPFYKKSITYSTEEEKQAKIKELQNPEKDKKQDSELDINQDGKFDKKDKSKAGKILATKIKK